MNRGTGGVEPPQPPPSIRTLTIALSTIAVEITRYSRSFECKISINNPKTVFPIRLINFIFSRPSLVGLLPDWAYYNWTVVYSWHQTFHEESELADKICSIFSAFQTSEDYITEG